MNERQITFAAHGHILTNYAVWSPDGGRLVYDVRSDPAGAVFDGTRIETVDVITGAVRVLYESSNRACCGVATFSPVESRVVFILGPEHPDERWSYGPSRRQGVMVDEATPGVAVNLDARDLVPPYTPGALRGGSHVHVFSGDGRRISFTYDDEVTPANGRNIGVSVAGIPVRVPKSHERNHDGTAYSVVVTKTSERLRPGSDEISRACEEGWIGKGGRAIAFQGSVLTSSGAIISEVFVADLPEDLIRSSGSQRRITFTADRKYPGIQGPRHWLRGSADGSRIGFLMRDDAGIAQLWTVLPGGGEPVQITRAVSGVESAFTWSGERVALVMDGRVCVVETDGSVLKITSRGEFRPEACVFSPDGKRVAFVRRVGEWNQIFVADVPLAASQTRGETHMHNWVCEAASGRKSG